MAQKQALIDNLQLESESACRSMTLYFCCGTALLTIATVTERARKLRAQYMLQAQGLRTRIEIRVNRIPMALRRAKMGDLYIKHSETSKPAATASRPEKTNSPRKNLMQAEQSNAHVSPSPQRGTKRLRYAIPQTWWKCTNHSAMISASTKRTKTSTTRRRGSEPTRLSHQHVPHLASRPHHHKSSPLAQQTPAPSHDLPSALCRLPNPTLRVQCRH